MARNIAVASGGNSVLIVQNSDIYRVTRSVKIPVFAQHMDPVGNGKFTGRDVARTLKENGASGILINHSEDRQKMKDIKSSINICKKEKMMSLVCAAKPSEISMIARMKPHIVAIEPPKLIGTGIPVSKAEPWIVRDSVRAVKRSHKRVTVLCGAGISTGDDVRAAIELGCHGVLAASAIMQARQPKKIMKEFISALPR